MKSRIGKVARLPKTIRDELNRRLDNGAEGPELLAWLNALPEVQQVLAKKFKGRPLTKHNLSDWRRGGYAEWAETRDGRLQWQDLIERALELNQDGADLSSHLATILIAELAGALQELREIEDSEQRWKVLQRISRTLSRLRMDDCREKQLDLRDAMEQRRSRQIAISRPELPSKKISFSLKPGAAPCVAQATSPASSRGVAPRVPPGGETPPELAAGAAALRQLLKPATELPPGS